MARKAEQKSIDHVRRTALAHLHHYLIPKTPLGCKRTINDGTKKGSYLAALHDPRMTLVTDSASRVEGSSVISYDGRTFDVDAICFSNGYKTTEYLGPTRIEGVDGTVLNDVWRQDEGAHAYKTISVSGFPNLALMFGPNSFPSKNSVISKAETQAEYVSRILLTPILEERSCTVLDVKHEVEERWYRDIRRHLTSMVWSTGCANWYLTQWGHNTSTFPGCGLAYRRTLLTTSFGDYDLYGKNVRWAAYRFLDIFLYWPRTHGLAVLCDLGDRLEKTFPLI